MDSSLANSSASTSINFQPSPRAQSTPRSKKVQRAKPLCVSDFPSHMATKFRYIYTCHLIAFAFFLTLQFIYRLQIDLYTKTPREQLLHPDAIEAKKNPEVSISY
jgi:hypothetical protein